MQGLESFDGVHGKENQCGPDKGRQAQAGGSEGASSSAAAHAEDVPASSLSLGTAESDRLAAAGQSSSVPEPLRPKPTSINRQMSLSLRHQEACSWRLLRAW
jgi:hypothetical protein